MTAKPVLHVMPPNRSTDSIQIQELVAVRGEVRLFESELQPPPPGHVRVRTIYSGISAGTELDMIARSRDSEGGEPVRLGYELCGVVEAVPEDLEGKFRVGQMVACFGSPYVHHASAVNVPRLLAVPLPDGIDPMEAAFCGLGTIALHAIRCGDVELGECVQVVGLGLVGNLVAQVARAAGCRVVAFDQNAERCDAAAAFEIPVSRTLAGLREFLKSENGDQGADAVFLAAGNIDDELLKTAVENVRLRGTVVIVGTADATVPRTGLFMKEAKLIVSRAGGPGRYDATYEAGGVDYPFGYVRWTEGRNLEHVVRMLKTGQLKIKPLLGEALAPGPECYDRLRGKTSGQLTSALKWEA